LGGDEFVIVLEELLQADVLHLVGQAVLNAIANPITIDKIKIKAGASIGAAMAPIDGETMPSLIKAADQAMYQAKLAGKNKIFYARNLKKHLNVPVTQENISA